MAVDITDLMRSTQRAAGDRLSMRAVQASADDPADGTAASMSNAGAAALKMIDDSPANKSVEATSVADILTSTNTQRDALWSFVDSAVKGMTGGAKK